MARITHVKKAQQRFATVPVTDAEGKVIRTPVIDKRTGEQKVSKRGPVFMTKTAPDKTNPLPELRCDFPGCTINGGKIAVGTPYKHISPKSGPYGGQQKNRHAEHPSWQVWEYSSSLSARLAQISHDFWEAFGSAEDLDGVTEALSATADEVRSLAEEKREAASNIEEGFGHPTSASEELEQTADDLDSWADDIESADLPEWPEPEDRWFITDTRTGEKVGETEDGYEDEDEASADLDSIIEDKVNGGEEDDAENYSIDSETPDDPSEEQKEEWREEAQDACSIVDESPV